MDEHLTLGYKVLKDTPLYIDDTFNLSLEELDKKIAELKAKGIKIVIMDYIQLIAGFEKDVELTLMTLKQIAENHEITIMALLQMHKSDMKIESDGSLDLNTTAQTLEEAYIKYADIVSVIHRPEFYLKSETSFLNKNIAEIHFIKNFHCDKKYIALDFRAGSGNFSNFNHICYEQ